MSRRVASMKDDAVVGVLLDAGAHGEDVGVEDDVLGREAHLLGQDPDRSRQDRDPALDGGRLALLVEGHHHHPGAVAADAPGVLDEDLLPLLEGDAS